MDSSSKYTWGIILSMVGWISTMVGLMLSFSLIGACIGIPMMVVGFPLAIWGTVWSYQGYYGKQQEVIAAGIQQGLASAKQLTSSTDQNPHTPIQEPAQDAGSPPPIIHTPPESSENDDK